MNVIGTLSEQLLMWSVDGVPTECKPQFAQQKFSAFLFCCQNLLFTWHHQQQNARQIAICAHCLIFLFVPTAKHPSSKPSIIDPTLVGSTAASIHLVCVILFCTVQLLISFSCLPIQPTAYSSTTYGTDVLYALPSGRALGYSCTGLSTYQTASIHV